MFHAGTFLGSVRAAMRAFQEELGHLFLHATAAQGHDQFSTTTVR